MPIHTLQDRWIPETDHTGYAFGLNNVGLLANAYSGERLSDCPAAPIPSICPFEPQSHLTREEYPAHGGVKYTDPCFKLKFADGVRDVVLRFDSCETRAHRARTARAFAC